MSLKTKHGIKNDTVIESRVTKSPLTESQGTKYQETASHPSIKLPNPSKIKKWPNGNITDSVICDSVAMDPVTMSFI